MRCCERVIGAFHCSHNTAIIAIQIPEFFGRNCFTFHGETYRKISVGLKIRGKQNAGFHYSFLWLSRTRTRGLHKCFINVFFQPTIHFTLYILLRTSPLPLKSGQGHLNGPTCFPGRLDIQWHHCWCEVTKKTALPSCVTHDTGLFMCPLCVTLWHLAIYHQTRGRGWEWETNSKLGYNERED